MRRKTRRIAIGVTACVLFIAAVAVPLLVRHARAHLGREADARRLIAVGMVVQLYAQDHAGAYPDTLAAGLHAEDQDPSFACCAASDQSTSDPRFPYVYLGHTFTSDHVGPATVVAYSPLAYSDGQGANVFFGDAHTSWVTAADLPAVLARGGPVTRPATLPDR